MKDISGEIAQYREAVRHLWNSTFYKLDESLRLGSCLELFEQIDDLIFRSLVCEPLGIQFNARASHDPIVSLKVVPVSSSGTPILINREIPASGYWDDPLRIIESSDVDLALIGLFDWDGYNFKDCAYYRVRIVDSKSKPYLVGRDALIETFYANIFLVEEG